MPSAQQMQMQVVDRLAAIRAGVDDHAVASIQPCIACDCRSFREQMPQQRDMRFLRMRLRDDVFPGNNQQMCRRLRMKVREAETQVVLIHTLRRNSTGNDPVFS